jgi:hypothetical protein
MPGIIRRAVRRLREAQAGSGMQDRTGGNARP